MEDPITKYKCTYCQEDIPGQTIKCAECTDIVLCLPCFSAGAEIGTHKNDHPYQFLVSEWKGDSLGRGSWSASENLKLLEAMEQCGFGNWEEISLHMKTRTAKEVKEEYEARFIEGSIGRLTWSMANCTNLMDHTASTSNDNPLSPEATSRMPPMDATRDEADQLGYSPEQDDYQNEFDNSAELLVSPLYIKPEEDDEEEDELDVNLNLTQVDMLTHRLRRRAIRKRTIRDYQLVAEFFTDQRNEEKGTVKKEISEEQKDLTDKLRVFSRFHTSPEHKRFVQGIVREKELKLRLSELYRYRKNGLTTKEECILFEQERLDLEDLKEEKSQQQ